MTVIGLSCFYIVVSIWCIFMDKRDSLKSKVHILADNNLDDDYFYEIIVFTGNRKKAGTTSNV